MDMSDWEISGEGRNESYNYIPINAVTGEEMVELEVE